MTAQARKKFRAFFLFARHDRRNGCPGRPLHVRRVKGDGAVAASAAGGGGSSSHGDGGAGKTLSERRYSCQTNPTWTSRQERGSGIEPLVGQRARNERPLSVKNKAMWESNSTKNVV